MSCYFAGLKGYLVAPCLLLDTVVLTKEKAVLFKQQFLLQQMFWHVYGKMSEIGHGPIRMSTVISWQRHLNNTWFYTSEARTDAEFKVVEVYRNNKISKFSSANYWGGQLAMVDS